MIRCPARLVYLGCAGALALTGLSLAQGARAAEPEQVVVRNRLYRDAGRFELQLNYTFNLSPGLTQMQGPVFDLAYHIDSAWAIDLLVGYVFGGSTDLFGQTQCPQNGNASGANANCTGAANSNSVFLGAYQPSKNVNKQFSDAPGLWAINGLDAQIGVRWEPVYGKLSLVSAVPVHFTWYFGVDGGVANFSRDSVSYCTKYDQGVGPNGEGDCDQTGGKYATLNQTRISWVASAATGLRFVFLKQASINAGLREYLWQDNYQSKFCFADSPSTADSTAACPANSKGSQSLTGSTLAGTSQSGITATLFADLGLSWTF